MPSDNITAALTLADQAMEALKPRLQTFHSAVATAEEEVRAFVHHQRGHTAFKGEQALVELGQFAIGRIDPERFAQLLGEAEDLAPQAEDVLNRAEVILAHFAADEQSHRISVEPGGDLRDVVKDALEYMGRVFGASRAVELARSGTFDPESHNHLLGSLGFRFWNRAERQLAPPLVVEVRGEDCLPAGLGEFLDGTMSIVLVATGPTTPAPLARLITPGTFVIQTADPADLRAMSASQHPGVALLFDAERPEQARFVHDPDAGATPADRLTVHYMPDQPDVGRGRRAPMWLEEVTHLAMLASSTSSGADGSAPAGAAEVTGLAAAGGAGVGNGAGAAVGTGTAGGANAVPADQLAAWLLSQTDLKGL